MAQKRIESNSMLTPIVRVIIILRNFYLGTWTCMWVCVQAQDVEDISYCKSLMIKTHLKSLLKIHIPTPQIRNNSCLPWELEPYVFNRFLGSCDDQPGMRTTWGGGRSSLALPLLSHGQLHAPAEP